MPSVYDNLITAKANIAAEIAAVSAILGPNYNKDGQSFDKIGYLKSLQDQLKDLDDMLAQEQPYEIRSTMAGQIYPWWGNCVGS